MSLLHQLKAVFGMVSYSIVRDIGWITCFNARQALIIFKTQKFNGREDYHIGLNPTKIHPRYRATMEYKYRTW